MVRAADRLSDPVVRVLDRLTGVRRTRHGVVAICPAHDDRHPSLAVAQGDDGRCVIHDFGGCKTVEVLAKLGLSWADLFSSPSSSSNQSGITRLISRACPRRSPLDDARHEVISEARRLARGLARYHETNLDADSVRISHQVVAAARRTANAIGDCEVSWTLLELAARLESDALATEARLDDEAAAR